MSEENQYVQRGLFTPEEQAAAQAAREKTSAPVSSNPEVISTPGEESTRHTKFGRMPAGMSGHVRRAENRVTWGSLEEALAQQGFLPSENDIEENDIESVAANPEEIRTKHKRIRNELLPKVRKEYKDTTSKIELATTDYEKAKSSFLGKKGSKNYEKRKQAFNMLNDGGVLEEAKAHYAQEIEEAELLGEKFDKNKITDRAIQNIRQRNGLSKKDAVSLANLYTKQNELQELKEKKSSIIGHLKNYKDHGRFTGSAGKAVSSSWGGKAVSGSWGGKAKIFGGIAAAALAGVGVCSLMMSGGRQSNSNLYNPYQAMY